MAAPTFGAEGTDGRAPASICPSGPGTRRAGRGHRVRGLWARGQGIRRGATPPVQNRRFVAEGAAILDTWLPPTCKVGSGRGRDKSGRV
jgi:hypothetical protein